VSKTWEHYHHAARDHEKAAYHFNEAAKYNQAEEKDKAAHHAYLAHGYSQHAIHHGVEAAKLHVEAFSQQTPVSGQAPEEKRAR
jgi:hypothetical protein